MSALSGANAAQHALFFEHGCSVKNRASAHVQNSGKFSCGYARIGGDTFKERKKFWCNFRCNIAQSCLRKPLFLVQILCFRCRFWCKPSRSFCQPVGSAYNGLEQRTLPIVFKVNIRPCLKSAQNAGADAVVGQKPLGGVRNQNGIADIGIAAFDIGDGQVVRQRAGADDFHPVIKDENTDGRADKIIPVYKGVDQQFLKDLFRYFWRAR